MIKWLICTQLYHQVAYQFQILPPQRHLLSIIQSSWKVDDDELRSQVKDSEQALAVKTHCLYSFLDNYQKNTRIMKMAIRKSIVPGSAKSRIYAEKSTERGFSKKALTGIEKLFLF